MFELRKEYNLEKRTSNFGVAIIRFCRSLEKNEITKSIISQLVRSGTSIGANYSEANAASSKRDFRNKIHICKKESQETFHWLKMISECAPRAEKEIQKPKQETHELTLIFGKILGTMKKKEDGAKSHITISKF